MQSHHDEDAPGRKVIILYLPRSGWAGVLNGTFFSGLCCRLARPDGSIWEHRAVRQWSWLVTT